MTVTFANGFSSAGVVAGLKSNGNPDLAVVVNQGPLQHAAAVFTSNRCQANPILWSKEAIKGGAIRAIVLNSGGANCYTGSEGFQTTHLTAEKAADLLGVGAAEILVCSTGIIGEQLDRTKLTLGLELAIPRLASTAEAGVDASLAIMTTDSRPKTAQFESTTGWRLGGMAKGAGMLAPGLATMLVVVTTDAVVSIPDLQSALARAVATTFNRLDSDGCMSTNDQVTLLASGSSGVQPDLSEFEDGLRQLCADLAEQLMSDAEGASHEIRIRVIGASSEVDAEEVGRAVARNNLFKAAIYGNDPNWGRILAAVGTTKATFDPFDIDVSINGIQVSSKGKPDQSRDLVSLEPREVRIEIDLHAGNHEATILTNDLTHAYVTENSAYSS